ncbi:Mannose-1-phosphate guanylyltransferase (GDP) [uncultured Candidatus Thioglobus sp.]|nr:Mannose-1-phosphate guanylyltransferase (GDP) [uncultured Candidatus Thioglobus sp.]
MLQETLLRLNGLDNLAEPIIVCNIEHRFLVAEQCQQIDIDNPTILLEPIGRNTAPAIAAAALQSLKHLDDATLLVLSADHVIQDIAAFHSAIDIANRQAQSGKLATFGIVPTDANTGYGYIKSSKEGGDSAYKVEKFVEKPDTETAQSYLKQGNYLWNSGMFMFKASVLIDELNLYSPDIVVAVGKSIDNATQDLDFIRLDKQAFEASPSDSIDYALMEKSDNVVVVPLDAKWNDIGTWSALYDIGTKDENSNVIKGDVFTEDTTNSYINASNHMIATIGVQDLVIVDTPNATLISSKNKAHKVKTIVQRLQQQGREEQFCHRKVYRPWGWYDSIETGMNFQVKRLHINPGAKLSLQMHHKRAEHWVVVIGTASVINGEQAFTLGVGESTYIPIGTTHGLENQTNEQLEIIEVQSGVYLGEDDIVRFEDIYGREKS